MQQLKTTIQWHLCISSLQPFRKIHTIIQSLNTRSLSLDFENIETNHNLQTFHILCLNETRVTMQHYISHPYATIQNIHQLKFMEAKELCFYMIELLYLIQVNPLQVLEENL
jgi:hypothetical protein